MTKTISKSAMSFSTRIAGRKTVLDWIDLRAKLLTGTSDISLWNQAFEMLRERIDTRFLRPMDEVLGIGDNLGEGHSAVALLCILIEFLEALFEGKVYDPPMTAEQRDSLSRKLGVSPEVLEQHTQPHTYRSSAILFQSFLTRREPIARYFNRRTASRFYREIRCGLVHEAATKGLSLIRDKKDSDVECIAEFLDKALVLYRTPLYLSIKKILEQYAHDLPNSSELQKNLVRKMDDICQIKRCHYFAYGSNLNTARLLGRVSVIHDYVTACLNNWIFRYNKRSDDQTSKANIEYNPFGCDFILGVCYELDLDDFCHLHKKYEKGYIIKDVWIESNMGPIIAKTFFVERDTWSRPPTQEYMDIIVTGAREHSFPEEYIAKYLDL